MAFDLSANVSLRTPPSVGKLFDISGDVSCVICEAVCSLKIKFSCTSRESLDDLSFKSKNNVLEEWLNECRFVNKFSESCVFNGSQLRLTIDEKEVDQTLATHQADAATDETYTNAETVVVKPPIKPKPLSPPPLMPRAKSSGAIAEDFRSKAERRKSYKIAVQRRAEQPGRFRSSPNISPANTPNNSPGIMRKKAIRPRTAIREEIYGDFIYQEVTPRMRPRTLTVSDLGAIGLGARKMWSEMPQVIEQGLRLRMSDKERKQQEAMFEIISTEHTYLKGLDTLVTHFIASPMLSYESILSKDDQKVLFSNVQQVREVSRTLCSEMEKLWQDSCVIKATGICNILNKFIEEQAVVYITNTRNSVFQERKLKSLKDEPMFTEELKKLELAPGSQSLPLLSYLTLPMQRITRLPLLLDAITKYMDPDANKEDYHMILRCQSQMQELVKLCNEGAREMSDIEEIADLDRRLHFKKVRKAPIVSKGRKIVKRGNLCNVGGTAMTTISLSKLLLDKKKDMFHVILLNDLLLITKNKGEFFDVKDYAPMTDVEVRSMESTRVNMTETMFSITMVQRKTEYILECESMIERERWVGVLSPPDQDELDESRIYEEWDCPQVQAHTRFISDEQDLLALEVTDVVKVLRKRPEQGWYFGERIRDGEKGWFPHAYTKEIVSEHTRTANMRKRHLLMLAAATKFQTSVKPNEENQKSCSKWYGN